MSPDKLKTTITKASAYIGKTWPLYSFVTSNPLSGYESLPFSEAVDKARDILGTNVYPEVRAYRQAWQSGEIDEKILKELLAENNRKETPEESLTLLEGGETSAEQNENHELDRLTVKWLSAYMDEGLAEWSMPGKENGLYQAWKGLAVYDSELKGIKDNGLPESAAAAIEKVLSAYPEDQHLPIITAHLAALPGWTGYIKFREESQNAWQQQYPVTLEDYLGMRLLIARTIKASIMPEGEAEKNSNTLDTLRLIWLQAWERSWQEQMLQKVSPKSARASENKADAQLVFCIDTRSEQIRKHVEAQGNYETFGYAGFFGVAMDYQNPKNGLINKSCPPILPSAYAVSEGVSENNEKEFKKFNSRNNLDNFFSYFLRRMKNMLPSTFGYVEGSGVNYGLALLTRTCFPRLWYKQQRKWENNYEHICEPGIDKISDTVSDGTGIPVEEQAAIVKSAFDLMGWKTFAPLVVFAGHGSHTANNPFGSSLDCGACAASRGRNNARMLARLANNPEVRRILREQHGVQITDKTWFLGAEHNTTTDEIVLFDAMVPASHQDLLPKLKADLQKAQHAATEKRLMRAKNSVEAAERKAGNWAETRPEWGLAKNAGFIIAPRSKTLHTDLGGRCFLHSYNWELDPEGKALEGIMQGPMVVTQWINNHYYFTSVDTENFGSGSKITHNVTGMFGVLQGNGGDLKSGLPLQSLRETDSQLYHQPLRLSVLIEAPIERVTGILKRNASLQQLLDNQWIHLLVTDPTKAQTFRYRKNLEWQPDANAQPKKATEKKQKGMEVTA
ncbi:DUF2309 domain-containing protein [Robertkochia aurantiaca]|uniref:DUF2309 domain-containing protein n=1 Tax=Robertkochia aurantiaca TaxID=2873700 RepID=UPI001CC94563|nr:DUF2309 domain-containing protein [Robertkochia sp. 3YJGBD-33]